MSHAAISTPEPDGPPGTPDQPDPHRWWALAVIALAQLMVVLDATIVNIALPSAQHDLHLTNGNRQWVVTAYTLAFGGLLLLGGRVADLVGRKRTFIFGLVGFAVASALGGASVNGAMLFGARALQGAFAAVLAPSALSLLTTTFSGGRDRAKAFGIYGAIAGAGAAIGLLLGGILTEYLDWRWCLYVNVLIAVLAVTGAVTQLSDRQGQQESHLDILGALLGCGGLVAIVYGVSQAETDGWSAPLVITLLIVGVVLLVTFGWWQKHAAHPMLPLHIIEDRNRSGSIITMALATLAMFGMFLFLTYYMQTVLDYSPMKTGFAYLPMSAMLIIASTQIAARLLHFIPPRLLMAPGMLIGAGGLYALTFIGTRSDYPTHILPGTLLLGFGIGLVFMPVMATATAGVAPQDSGVTSATVNTAQQVGGSIGTSLLNTIATTTTATYLASHLASAHSKQQQAQITNTGVVHGFTVATGWAAIFMVAGAVVAFTMVTGRAPKAREAEAEAASG
ncbi:MFS transporter [Streptomyces sp. NBC_01500]|uniref:MFS transporter n=1 Tax=Streptomyces sp. NBC_01500 TaxID=2903886 RepID=UPI002250FFB0|nr:MFS transporter [Streptomyces sp. NBC_01500]MCX4550029.1 MFS transporter [Streptomyces sp. NBC_01500]